MKGTLAARIRYITLTIYRNKTPYCNESYINKH